ncbi:MAG: SOS response-associated peptidase family protein [Hyphomonadaceae bacterium]
MCNLYSHESNHQAISKFVEQLDLDLTMGSNLGNYAPGFVGADQDAPVLRPTGHGLELSMVRWGFPPAKAGSKKPITNIRNLESRWWRDVNRQWLFEPVYRCLIPFDRFADPVPGQGRKLAWFKPATTAYFAGVWRPWTGERLIPVEGKSRRQRVETQLDLFAFLTCEPNAIVEPIHPKAMPVILTKPDEAKDWLSGVDPKSLQRPLAEDKLELVADTA